MGKEEEIRIIAFSLWVRDGFGHGDAVKHWLEAEAIWEYNRNIINKPVPLIRTNINSTNSEMIKL
jgi:hypothetical protein